MRCSSLLFLIILPSGGNLLAQSPPIKMGLWEKKMVISTSVGEPHTITAKSCVTPQTWEEMVSRVDKPRPNCTNNMKKTGNGYTFDTTCSGTNGMSIQVKGSSTIKDSEHIVSESHSTTTINGKTRQTSTQSTGRFVSVSCGNIKPRDPEVGGDK